MEKVCFVEECSVRFYTPTLCSTIERENQSVFVPLLGNQYPMPITAESNKNIGISAGICRGHIKYQYKPKLQSKLMQCLAISHCSLVFSAIRGCSEGCRQEGAGIWRGNLSRRGAGSVPPLGVAAGRPAQRAATGGGGRAHHPPFSVLQQCRFPCGNVPPPAVAARSTCRLGNVPPR